MPRKIGLASAGRWYQDNIPVPGNGRGGEQERIDFLATLTISKVLEYLFEGTSPAYRVPNVGGQNLSNIGGDPVLGGAPLSFASPFAIEYPQGVNLNDRQTGSYAGAGTYVYELWYQQPPKNNYRLATSVDNVMVGQQLNSNQVLGGRKAQYRALNFPCAINAYNNGYDWECMLMDLFEDNLPHQIMEVHDIGVRNTYTVYIDGIPIAQNTNGGRLILFDTDGPAFNGYNNPINGKAGPIIGSFTLYDGAQQLDQNDVRNLFENSSFNGHDMLPVPGFIPLDQQNMTFPDIETVAWNGSVFFQFSTNYVIAGDVNNATGTVSGAIPRRGKIYFEVSIEEQGDSSNSSRLGIRKMISSNVTGAQPTEVGSDWALIGNTVYEAPITSTGFTCNTVGTNLLEKGTHFMVAIDWDTGQFWFGKDGTWNSGGGDPENGVGYIDILDRNTNWCVHVMNNSTVGNSHRLLRTKWHQLKYPPPDGFDSWEADTELALEPAINGENRRKAAVQFLGTSIDSEWLWEGGNLTEIVKDTGDRIVGPNATAAVDPTYGGDQLSHSSPTSVNWGTTYSMTQGFANFFAECHAWELIFRQVLHGGPTQGLMCQQNNLRFGLGRRPKLRWPMIQNSFNNAIYMQSDVNYHSQTVDGDENRIYHIMEVHESSNSDEFITVLNGMPISSDVGQDKPKGMMASVSAGWQVNNTYNLANGNRAKADYGSLTLFRGGHSLNLYKARKVFEASALDGTQMLSTPRWWEQDTVNSTVSTDGKTLTLGDVASNTGGRSGALPRVGKVYFEIEVVSEGDSPFSVLGLRQLCEESKEESVGALLTGAPAGESYTQRGQEFRNSNFVQIWAASQSGFTLSPTGFIYSIAIDWDTGEFWWGNDGVWNGVNGSGPDGDPSAGINPVATLDIEKNWGVHATTNVSNGNQVYKLLTGVGEFNYAMPTDYKSWDYGDAPRHDPDFASVALSMPFGEGPHQATVAEDRSLNKHVATFVGGAELNDTRSRYAITCLDLDGNSDRLTIPNHSSFDLSNNEFTFEADVLFISLTNINQMLGCKWKATGDLRDWFFRWQTGALVAYYSSDGTDTVLMQSVPFAPSTFVWYHIAWVRDNSGVSDEIRTYVNGVQLGTPDTTIDGVTISHHASDLFIGDIEDSSNQEFYGQMNNLRLTNGVCRYTADFPPPIREFEKT